MTDRRRGLGRGLGALIPTAPAEPKPSPAAVKPQPRPTPAESAPRRASAGGKSRRSPLDVFFPDDAGSADVVSRETSAENARVEADLPDDETGVDAGAAASSGEPEADLVPVSGAHFAEVPVAAIRANPRQPRQVFDEEAMQELVHSIREVGLLQPVVVRPVDDGDIRYELVMGERRWRATQEAGLATIPAIVRETGDDALLRDALLENLHRSQLNPLEEAAAYQQLLDDFGCTHEELAGRIGRSRPQISNTVRLLRLPPTVQRRVAAGVLTSGHARALLAVTDAAAQERLAQRIVAEGLSVRSVEEIVALGAEDERAPRRRLPKPVAPRLADIAADLSERLDTRVKVDLGRSKGKITVEFASIEDLERIVGAIAPEPTASEPENG